MITTINEAPATPLAITSLGEFVFGRAPHPLVCGCGLEIGKGQVVPEINFTLPPVEIKEQTWTEIRQQYTDIIESICERAVDLEVPGLLVEFETLPEMTLRPDWGLEITSRLAETLQRFHANHGLKNALRVTPNDTRELRRLR